MRISRIGIINFANFANLDVRTGDNIVVVGENKVGKSNFIRALQLILDPGMSERDRHLGLDDFWDGLRERKLGASIEIFVEFTDFTNNPRLMAHLADCVTEAGPPMVARLTYRFQPKANLEGPPESLADYEDIIFGGGDPDRAVIGGFRRMLPLDIQGALRDTEKDLASWRRSPLRPLIEELMSTVDDDARDDIQDAVNDAQTRLAGLDQVVEVARRIGQRLVAIAGPQHAVPISLGVAPTQIDALLRALRILIDDGARDIGGASPARAPDVRGWTVVSRRSSELVPQFEGEGHGNQLSVAVPHQLCAGRVALASEPPAEAPDQTDSVAEARRRRQLA